MANKKIVFWRGSRKLYNTIKSAGMLDYWTRYSVKESDGTWTEYYGDNLVNVPTGNLYPVIDILTPAEYSAMENEGSLNPGDRYLVGNDESGYVIKITAISKEDDSVLSQEVISFANVGKTSDYSVRVKNKGMKAYVYVDDKLKTYDDVNGGTF